MTTKNKIAFLLNPDTSKIKSNQNVDDSDTEYSSETETYIQALESLFIQLVNEEHVSNVIKTALKRRK